jgi:hypothetical protein
LSAVAWRPAVRRDDPNKQATGRASAGRANLRHAAVSTWLNGDVAPTTVAERAGHSVEVLLRIYAKCLDGGDALIRRRVEAAFGHADIDAATDAR